MTNTEEKITEVKPFDIADFIKEQAKMHYEIYKAGMKADNSLPVLHKDTVLANEVIK